MSQPDFSAMSRMVETTLQALDKARGAPTGDGEDDGEELRGTGEAAEGMIRVAALPGGRLADLELDPRVMRMDSITLAKEILTATNAALADLQEKLKAGLVSPDLNALASQLTEVQQESSRQMSTFIQSLVDAQDRIAQSGRLR
jgi:DNA-binding protein YbaB